MLDPTTPALILAPMDGLTDAPMRAVQGEIGAFTFAVAEFIRISVNVPSKPVFHRSVPELLNDGRTRNGLPVHVQLLGGHAGRMAEAAVVACEAGAKAIDINFGCPSPTVNGHDGGASLLQYPLRIREIVAAVRDAVPKQIPVSAKLRLGWDSIEAIHENAEMAAAGGASHLTIHARTRAQAYKPPVYWKPIGVVRERLQIPIVANGDLWSLESFRMCREETGCVHFMLGRGAIADYRLSHQIAAELGIHRASRKVFDEAELSASDWRRLIVLLADYTQMFPGRTSGYLAKRSKQWLKIANVCRESPLFHAAKYAETMEDLIRILEEGENPQSAGVVLPPARETIPGSTAEIHRRHLRRLRPPVKTGSFMRA